MQNSRTSDVMYIALILVLSVLSVLALPRVLPFIQVMENWIGDVRVAALSAPRPQNDEIVIVAITEDTLATLPYRSPVDRALLADVLQNLEAAGVRAIGLDVLFDQPTEPAKDEALRKTMLELSLPLVVAIADHEAQLTTAQAGFLERYTYGLTTGYANFVKDRADGVVRSIYPGKTREGVMVPGMAPALAQAVGASAPKGTLKLDYHSRPDGQTPAFRSYPAHLVGNLPKDWLKGRIVLVGSDLPLIDRHRTPFATTQGSQGVIPGVAIHAHTLSQLLDQRTFPQLGGISETAVVMVLAVIGMALAILDTTLVTKAALSVFAVVAYMFVSGAAWRYGGPMIPVAMPTLGFAISMGGGIAYFGRRDREQKKFIREAFSRYLSPTLVKQLIDDPSQLKVGGERRELTYVFTDIASFTSLTERSDPAQLVPLLNDYIDGMCQTALEHGATLDKIVGDATICFFNAPLDQPDHPAQAIACALALDAFAQDFVSQRASGGLEVGITRIGVHTGIATIGNFGGEAFFDYTAFGDMVNTAARLESVNKHLGTRVCVSEATASRCPDVAFRPAGVLVLKGKSEGIKVFEPLSKERAGSPAYAAYLEAYRMMSRNDPSAQDAFRKILDDDPDDPLALLHLRRLANGERGDTIVMKEK